MPPSRNAPPGRDLSTRVRKSRVMTAELKKYWLGVLPYLSEQERAKLEALLDGEERTPERAAPNNRRPGRSSEP